jgi:CTP:molybdopterin cytidylyltransferase MocA
MRLVGVVPAAGHASRLQPLAGSKELLEVGGRPVLEYVVERMIAAGADEIRVVTRPDKPDVAEHARALGALVVVGEPSSSAESILLALEGLATDDLVMVGFPDTIWQPVSGLSHVLRSSGTVRTSGSAFSAAATTSNSGAPTSSCSRARS